VNNQQKKQLVKNVSVFTKWANHKIRIYFNANLAPKITLKKTRIIAPSHIDPSNIYQKTYQLVPRPNWTDSFMR